MKLLSALKQQATDNCIIVTYNADLLFFEHLLFEPLYGAGCRNTLVICDPAQYALSLADVAQLRYAGQRYLVAPGRTSPNGAFHPKLILLTSREHGYLVIGSSNLTRPGYTRNWEVATKVEYDDKHPDPAAWGFFRWAYGWLSVIVQRSDPRGLARQRLDQMLATTPWLRREDLASPMSSTWPLDNLNTPLFHQVLAHYYEIDGSPVTGAVVVSPYFDLRAQVVARLLEKVHPAELCLYTQGLAPGFDPAHLHRMLSTARLAYRIGQLNADGRRLHAKALLLRTQRGAWLATGSANFSAPAWLHAATAGNTECTVLRHEPDPAYFDAWLDELVATARPLALLEDVELPARSPAAPELPGPALLNASLSAGRLVLQFAAAPPPGQALCLHLQAEARQELKFKAWQHEAEADLTLELPVALTAHLDRPTLVSVSFEGLISNTVLLHNRDALVRFGQPLDRRDRPRIPEGMTPESYEHCSQLLEMLQDLLATNRAQFDRHSKRITIAAKAGPGRRTGDDGDEEKYDPKQHFVSEPVVAITATDGSELYVDFYDRLTYQDVFRAAMAATYHPRPHAAPERLDEELPPVTMALPVPSTLESAAVRAQLLARIERGFDRLVGNFLTGLDDKDYMAVVPPTYLAELFVIITTYLRVVFRDGLLPAAAFAGHSLRLLAALTRTDGPLPKLHGVLGVDGMARQEQRLALSAQTWLHAFTLGQVLKEARDRRFYDLAAWMRDFTAYGRSPTALAELARQDYRRVWRSAFPSSRPPESVEALIAHISDMSRAYDETTLLAEIAGWNGARAQVESESVAGLTRVPALKVKAPFSAAPSADRTVLGAVDHCFKLFVAFLLWPESKPAAWARFVNDEPHLALDAIKTVTIFYRSDRSSLLLIAACESGRTALDIYRLGIRAEDLEAIRSVEALAAG